MADGIDLGVALDSIVAALGAQFPSFATVAAEDESRTNLTLPALIVQLAELEPNPSLNATDDTFPCLVRVEARIVLGNRTPKVRREVIKAAGAIAAFVNEERLGVAWGPAQVIAVAPDNFSPQAVNYDVWLIEWVHAADIGPSFVVDDGVTPTQVFTSHAPLIGIPHEQDYQLEVD